MEGLCLTIKRACRTMVSIGRHPDSPAGCSEFRRHPAAGRAAVDKAIPFLRGNNQREPKSAA